MESTRQQKKKNIESFDGVDYFCSRAEGHRAWVGKIDKPHQHLFGSGRNGGFICLFIVHNVLKPTKRSLFGMARIPGKFNPFRFDCDAISMD